MDKKKSRFVPVVFSTDHAFIMPTGVAMCSILKYSVDCFLDFFVFCDSSVTNEDKQCLRSIVENDKTSENRINFIGMGDAFKDSYEARGVTHATYFRLKIPWVINQYDKVIYCDGDVIFKKSIRTLYEISIGDNYCAGVKRFLYDGYSYRKHAKRLGLNADDYINAGVMAINLKQMRKNCLDKQFEKYAKNSYRYFDQDIVNIVCKGHIATLPLKYNVMPSMDISDDEICVIHYAGLKPWKNFTRHWYDWWTIYKSSPFFDQNLEMKIVARPLSLKQSAKVWAKWHCPKIYNRLRNLLGEMPA